MFIRVDVIKDGLLNIRSFLQKQQENLANPPKAATLDLNVHMAEHKKTQNPLIPADPITIKMALNVLNRAFLQISIT